MVGGTSGSVPSAGVRNGQLVGSEPSRGSNSGPSICRSNTSAPPLGARLRLKGSKNISTFTPEVQRIFRAMKRYGLIVADNGSDMYISGTMDGRWNNDVLNPAFGALTADDFEVIQFGWQLSTAPSSPTNLRILR